MWALHPINDTIPYISIFPSDFNSTRKLGRKRLITHRQTSKKPPDPAIVDTKIRSSTERKNNPQTDAQRGKGNFGYTSTESGPRRPQRRWASNPTCCAPESGSEWPGAASRPEPLAGPIARNKNSGWCRRRRRRRSPFVRFRLFSCCWEGDGLPSGNFLGGRERVFCAPLRCAGWR